MKRILRITGILLLVFLLVLGVVIFLNPKKVVRYIVPELKQINEVNIAMKGDSAYINSSLTVQNRSFLSMAIDSIKYKIKLIDKEYLQSEKYLGLKLKPGQIDTLDFAFSIPFNEVMNDLREERKLGDSTDYTINISLVYSTIFGAAELPYKKTAKIKIPQPPKIELVKVHYNKIRLKHFEAEADLKIINYNKIELIISNLDYSMDIAGRGKVAGTYTEPIHIKPNGETYVTMPLKVDLKNIGKTLLDVITNEDNYEYILTLNGIVKSPHDNQEPVKINLIKEGKMELKK